jgi:hypothetical protein
MNFTQCLHIVLATGKHRDVFRGDFFWLWGGGGVTVSQNKNLHKLRKAQK